MQLFSYERHCCCRYVRIGNCNSFLSSSILRLNTFLKVYVSVGETMSYEIIHKLFANLFVYHRAIENDKVELFCQVKQFIWDYEITITSKDRKDKVGVLIPWHSERW